MRDIYYFCNLYVYDAPYFIPPARMFCCSKQKAKKLSERQKRTPPEAEREPQVQWITDRNGSAFSFTIFYNGSAKIFFVNTYFLTLL